MRLRLEDQGESWCLGRGPCILDKVKPASLRGIRKHVVTGKFCLFEKKDKKEKKTKGKENKTCLEKVELFYQ